MLEIDANEQKRRRDSSCNYYEHAKIVSKHRKSMISIVLSLLDAVSMEATCDRLSRNNS